MGIFWSRSRFHERPADKASVLTTDDRQPCCDPGCEYTAGPRSSHCCEDCRASQAKSHSSRCSRLTKSLLANSWWERVSRSGKPHEVEDAKCMVIPPSDPCRRASAVLFLLGDGHVGGKQDLLEDAAGHLLQNPVIRSTSYVIVPLPSYESGSVRWCRKPEWDDVVVWEVFTEVLRRLGSDRVDFARLYATGISMGAAGVWNLAIRYGDLLAAVAPIAGRCGWPENSWPMSSSMPHPEATSRLQNLPIRAYQTSTDRYADSPTEDMEWLGKGCAEFESELTLPGVENGKCCRAKRRVWQKPAGGPDMELWSAQGPLEDWPSCHLSQRFNDHLLWYRVFPREEWDLGSFFQQHWVSRSRRWHPDLKLDSRRFEPYSHAESGVDKS